MKKKLGRTVEPGRLYEEAQKHWSNQRMRRAFRMFLAAANAGVVPAFRIVGQFYDRGDGVEADEEAALRWYRRAYRRGSDAAANNIGCIWRDRGKAGRALWWFRRALELGDDDANLEIARIYLRSPNLEKARQHLDATRRSGATEGSKEEASRLLKRLENVATKRTSQSRR